MEIRPHQIKFSVVGFSALKINRSRKKNKKVSDRTGLGKGRKKNFFLVKNCLNAVRQRDRLSFDPHILPQS